MITTSYDRLGSCQGRSRRVSTNSFIPAAPSSSCAYGRQRTAAGTDPRPARAWPARRRPGPGPAPGGCRAAANRRAAGPVRQLVVASATSPRIRLRRRRSVLSRWRRMKPRQRRSRSSRAIRSAPTVSGRSWRPAPRRSATTRSPGDGLRRAHGCPPGRRTAGRRRWQAAVDLDAAPGTGVRFSQPSITAWPRVGEVKLEVTWPTTSPSAQIGLPSVGAGPSMVRPTRRRWSGRSAVRASASRPRKSGLSMFTAQSMPRRRGVESSSVSIPMITWPFSSRSANSAWRPWGRMPRSAPAAIRSRHSSTERSTGWWSSN